MARRSAPVAKTATPLQRYAAKRDFERTPEPKAARGGKKTESLSFVIQKHWASRLHYDLRLEFDGVMHSWAVPRGPCFDPQEKRVAIHVEEHPVSYNEFEGTIPPKQYGAGTVIVWDRGTWEPADDPRAGLVNGKLLFKLHGEKLAGLWELVRIAKPGDKQDPWILFKKRDAWARPLAEYDVITALPDSVVDKPLGLLEQRAPPGFVRPPAPSPAALTPAALPGAVKAELPVALAPQLATLASSVPAQGSWHYELKFDGYRLLARVAKGRARLFTRNGNDWTDRMKPLAAAIESLGVQSAWLDGEIVVLGPQGTPDFHLLQKAFDSAASQSIDYFLFDLPFLDGFDLRAVPLQLRRDLLRQLVDRAGSDRIRFSADFVADAHSILASVRTLGLEGIVAKRADSPYVSQRTTTWLKVKVHASQEFVIGGYVPREGSNAEVGSLLLGVYGSDGQLRYVGNVGTGWSAQSATELRQRLQKSELTTSPFAGTVAPGRWTRRAAGQERWVAPQLVAQVRFADWTPQGHIRHATFVGLRDDKPASAVSIEVALPTTMAPERVRAVKVSHPERVIDPSTGLKKLDLVRYYESVAEWMMPHLSGRPVSLVRGPQGVTGPLFFQKHDDKTTIPGVRELNPALWPGHAALLEVSSAQALVAAAQMNVIEFHTWNSTVRAIDKPDRLVFDLDPGEGVAWSRVQEAATLTRAILTELGLQCWLKTSGGKGLHVVVPITPRQDYDSVKGFAQAVVQHLARTIPSRFVAKSGPANRVGRIFVDYLRNGHGATTAAAFSARARPGLGVSMPVAWDQLPALKSGAQWTIATAREHLSFQKADPWAAYWTTRQTLTKAMKVIGVKPTKSPG